MVTICGYVYVLKCNDGSYYVGSTKDIRKRLAKHREKGVKFTKSRLPVSLIFLKKFERHSEAVAFKRKIKSWKKRKSIEKMLAKPDNIVSFSGVV